MNIQPNTLPTRVAATIALGGIAICGAYFNARYGWSLGHDTDEKIALAAVSVAFDIAKVLAFAYAIHHVLKRAWVHAMLAGMIWIATASYAGYSAGSFVFKQISSAEHEQTVKNKAIEAREALVKAADRKVEEAKAAINSKGKNIWASSGACLTPTTPESNAFCHAYFIELSKLDRLREEMKGGEVQTHGNPVLAEWAKVTGRTEREVMIVIAILLAIAIEMVGSFAGVAFSKNHADTERDRQDARDEARAESNRLRRQAEAEARAERNERARARRKAAKRQQGRQGLRLVK